VTVHISADRPERVQGRMAPAPLPNGPFHQGGLDPVFAETRAWTRHYVLDSFRVRSERLGSIESHPDFE